MSDVCLLHSVLVPELGRNKGTPQKIRGYGVPITHGTNALLDMCKRKDEEVTAQLHVRSNSATQINGKQSWRSKTDDFLHIRVACYFTLPLACVPAPTATLHISTLFCKNYLSTFPQKMESSKSFVQNFRLCGVGKHTPLGVRRFERYNMTSAKFHQHTHSRIPTAFPLLPHPRSILGNTQGKHLFSTY
ncbi:hypothetical protein POVWA2_037220 [Plasmodium ovale wallikeri]|uniref:Uncharacterized protein n=1 Tax=Plasmodium ovale wallikeri TaxID=864142 RepID=A0A1A8Z414_PLAOA|nr:hypothetical protein POVWA1_038250 [Plasmodium ovale wallikeri]SBT39185.1 hypothetical protein POVWA2_037220 [Plasmodium ovale wallikeri]